MKEIKTKRYVEEVCCYEANDGKRFKSKEECYAYEETAKAVIYEDFRRLMVGEPFCEAVIWEDYGYGSEDFMLAIIEIKNAEDLHSANMFAEAYKFCGRFSSEDIGKRMLINLGYYGSYGDVGFCQRTESELIEVFTKNLQKYFDPEKKEGESSDNS